MNYKSLERRIKFLESNLLLESKQVGIIYHVCTLDAYLKYILPKDTLSASGKYINHLYGGNDWVSFTRDVLFVTNTKHIADSPILIQLVIDGDKLSERYKVRPYNDLAFGPQAADVGDDGLGNTDFDDSDDIPEWREMEECVKGPIKNISKYITEVHIDLHGKVDSSTLSKLKKSKTKLKGCTYFPFIRDKDNDALSRELSKLNIGGSVAAVIKCLDECVNNNSGLMSGMQSAVIAAVETGKFTRKELVDAFAYYVSEQGLNVKCAIALLQSSKDLVKALQTNGFLIRKLVKTYNDTYNYKKNSGSAEIESIFRCLYRYGVDVTKFDYMSSTGSRTDILGALPINSKLYSYIKSRM